MLSTSSKRSKMLQKLQEEEFDLHNDAGKSFIEAELRVQQMSHLKERPAQAFDNVTCHSSFVNNSVGLMPFADGNAPSKVPMWLIARLLL